MAPMISYDGIINDNFIDRLEKDIKKYDILFLCAPFGWGNASILRALYDRVLSKDTYWLEETEDLTLEQQIASLSSKNHVVFVPNLETVVERGEQDLIWNLLEKKKAGDIFVIASAAFLPVKMLPYTLIYRYVSYGIEDLRPRCEDVAKYMKRKGISLSQSEILRIEKDCNNLPLFIQLLANILSGTSRGYTQSVKEQCFEDLFSYIDVAFFRSFCEEDQNAMMKLSCFEEFDNQLVSYMLDISRKEADDLIERILIKSSVLDKAANGWRFFPMMKRFLERAIQKYLYFEERLDDYKRAMKYLISKEKWFFAMRFAYILQDKEKLAYCMDLYLKENEDYNDISMMEEYFRELPIDILMEYPDLMIQGSILKAIVGDIRASKKYERRYLQYMEGIDDESEYRRLQLQLLFLYMSRPGMMRDDILEIATEILSNIEDSDDYEEHLKFQPYFISVLRGEKDYCRYFALNASENHTVEKLHEIADKLNDSTYSMMLKFMKAEVHYERNELDQALDEMVKVSREAKIGANQRVQQLCMIAMIDLLAAKNQMSTTESFPSETIEAEEQNVSLFRLNCQAHRIYYHLLKGEKEPIIYWMNHIAPDEQEHFLTTQYYQYLIKAKVYLWLGQYVRARMILQVLLDYAEQYKMSYLEAQIRMLEAVIYYKEESSLWKGTLLPALEWAKKLGFVRVFADEGAVVYELLNHIASEDKEWEKDEFLKKVMTASKAHMLQYPKYLKMEQSGELGEFSNSEKSVMRLLVLGEKNAEIATQLCVSENTVKYHLKNIYQKLQVKSRSQAIHKIGEHNLI